MSLYSTVASRPSAAWSQLSARSDPVFVPTASGEPWDLPRTFTRGVPYPTLTLMFVGAAAAGGGAGPNRCCQLAHNSFFSVFSFIYRRMSLSYFNASTARIISRASTFLLLIISYDVFTSPLSLSRLYDDLFPALPSLGSDGPPSRVPLRECSEGWYRLARCVEVSPSNRLSYRKRRADSPVPAAGWRAARDGRRTFEASRA